MIIGVLSDSHDNIWKLDQALPHLRQADVVLHCGDLCAPFMVTRLGQGLPQVPIHIVWGNNDGDTYLIAQKASAFPAITLHGALAEVELDGLVVALNHYPEIARDGYERPQFDRPRRFHVEKSALRRSVKPADRTARIAI
ncbi:MAG: metallophosphoesterase family protein [Anaerolineales bacterium]